jgi:RNA polymerase sigma-B factor
MHAPLPEGLERRNRRVADHLFLVRSVANHYAACTRERRDDLQQVAALGLIRAAERYDSSSDVPFVAFARPHVRGAVLHYLRDVAPLLRVSRRLHEQAQRLNRQVQDALAQQQALPTALVAELEALARERSVELVPPWRLQEAETWRLDQRGDHNHAQHEAAEHGHDAMAALQQLEQRQREVVESVVLKGQTLRTVGQHLGVSAATVHRVLHLALAELRRQLNPASDAQAC